MNCDNSNENINNSLFYLQNKYISSFKIDKAMNIQIFASRISSFIHLVNYWSQALGYIVFTCESHIVRKKIINNLMDENCAELTHVETFYNFLVECGYVGKLDDIKSNHIISKYHNLLKKYVTDYDFKNACIVLGSIEYVYHMISKEINKYFIDKLYYTPINHYTTHEIVDIKHAIDLFECSSNPFLTTYLDIGAEWIINCLNDLIEFKPAFGFTYEDSDVEKYALSQCDAQQTGLIILSGGDTMFDIAGVIDNLIAVDMNLGQINLVNEKINNLKLGLYENFLNEIDNRQIVYDNLFCKLKCGNSFENVFALESLKHDFGESAVQNTSCNFANHFNNVSNSHGIYHSWIFDRNLKLKIEKSKNFNVNLIDKVNIEHNLFENLLYPNTYDFIQTSNITDWMNYDEFVKFCNKVKLSLKIGGVLVMRRLASDNILKCHFQGAIEVEDKTGLYNECIYWKK